MEHRERLAAKAVDQPADDEHPQFLDQAAGQHHRMAHDGEQRRQHQAPPAASPRGWHRCLNPGVSRAPESQAAALCVCGSAPDADVAVHEDAQDQGHAHVG